MDLSPFRVSCPRFVSPHNLWQLYEDSSGARTSTGSSTRGFRPELLTKAPPEQIGPLNSSKSLAAEGRDESPDDRYAGTVPSKANSRPMSPTNGAHLRSHELQRGDRESSR